MSARLSAQRQRILDNEALALRVLREASQPLHSSDVRRGMLKLLVSGPGVRHDTGGSSWRGSRLRTVTYAEAAEACQTLYRNGQAIWFSGAAGGKYSHNDPMSKKGVPF